MITEVRTFSGRGNNQANQDWGRAGQALLRFTTPAYVGGSRPSGPGRPNPRRISNIVCSQSAAVRPHSRLTDFMWAWGQFLDHEIDLSPEDSNEGLPIPVERGDPHLPAGGHIEFSRSIFDFMTGSGHSNPRQQINVLSAYIDASNVYGADSARASVLRTGARGLLKMDAVAGRGSLLPKNTAGLPNATGPNHRGLPSSAFFVAGDVRSNEHIVLTCMHTLFAREHNRLCEELVGSGRFVSADDEGIYQHARRVVGAFMQWITYNEFLVELLGKDAIAPYQGYDPAVNAGVSNLFSTACYRLGHTMVSPKILIKPARGKGRKLALKDAFWDPARIDEIGISDVLRGCASQHMQKMDVKAADGLRNQLFFAPDKKRRVMNDLAALNIQRGRDHGLPDYNTCRVNWGLAPKRAFSEISASVQTQRRLRKAYGSVDLVDPWIGGLAEDAHREGEVGELIFTVLRDQFERARDGDRFWFENDPAFTPEDMAMIKCTRLSDVIERNTNVRRIRKNVFAK